ncbi:MAG: EAL domain-containing protein [Terracidiphilus sp.]|nr:EAL domain-containing protein [Terracidiphilus sp.]
MNKGTANAALLVESDPGLADAIRAMFNQQGPYAFELSHVNSIEDAERHLAAHPVDVILLDVALAGTSELDAVLRTHAAAPHASIILLCAEYDRQLASNILQGDVQDYLIKGKIEPHELLRAMHNAVARKELQEPRFGNMNRAMVTLNSIGDAVICTDREGNISFLNPVAEAMTGWTLKEVAGHPLTEAFCIIDAATGQIAPNPMTKALGENSPAKMPVNCILIRRDGQHLFIEDSVAPIRDSNGMEAGAVMVVRDVTLARALSAQLIHLAEHDALTGLPNRLLLNDRLGQAIARASRDKALLAVLFVDLDGFKLINDSLGHRIGDQLLESVAKRLLKCIRTPDSVGRQGGDEFIVLLSDMQRPEDAAIAAKRILKAIAKPHFIANRDLHIAASVGVSIFPDDALDAETLIRNADTAMYKAKESGGQTFKFFQSEMNIVALERQAIEEDLRLAMERSELALHYQPQIDLKSGGIIGVEALLRWTHPIRGSVPPAHFIPIAEASGLMPVVGTWVLREACKQARAWTDTGLPATTMAVNVSSKQLRDAGFLKQLTAILDETGLDPQLLEIEVTEDVLMEHPELTARMFQILHERGVHLVIDDFGAGFSSMSYLAKLPLDALKISQSYISKISTTPEHKALVCAIIGVARSLGLRVVAEGVETAEELAFLKQQNCDETQGHLFSRALPADRLVSLLTA